MNPFHLGIVYPGDGAVAFLIVVTLTVSLLSGTALLVASRLRRRPAMRHGVLLAGLVCSILVPILVGLTGWARLSFIQTGIPFPVVTQTPGITTNSVEEAAPPSESVELTSTANDSNGPEPANQIEGSHRLRSHAASFSGHSDERASSSLNSKSSVNQIQRPVWFCVIAAAVCLIWAIGSIVVLVGAIRANLLVRVIRRGMQDLTEPRHLIIAEEVRQQMNLQQLPRIGVSSLVTTPVVVGLLRPQIILPQSLIQSLSDRELQEILIHETAHVIRRDLWIVHGELISVALMWPIPLVRLLIRQLSQVREELCDLYVVQSGERVDYGRTLLRIARSTINPRPLKLATGILHGSGMLERRVASLLDTNRDESTTISKRTAIGILSAFLLVTVVGSGTRLVASPQNQEQNAAPVSASDVRVSIDDTDDESKILEKIELLGADIERDETLPGRPVTGISIEACPRFTDPFLRLLPKVKTLTSLRIKSNDITDAGIVEVWKIKNLKTLDLYSQRIKGSGLKGIGGLQQLTTLRLEVTPVTADGLDAVETGSLNGLEELTNLVTLDLGGTMVRDTDRVQWEKLTNLRSLTLDTQCNDALLKGVSGLRQLTSLVLPYGRLTAETLDEINRIVSLHDLSLDASNIAEFGLDRLSGLKDLTLLNLEHTDFSDELMNQIDQFPNLQSLNLQYSEVSDAGVKNVGRLKNLTALNLSGTEINDKALKVVGRLTSLRSLNLDSTDVTDAGVAQLKDLTELMEFAVSGEKITDRSMQIIGRMKNLTSLDLRFSRVTAKGVRALGDLHNLQVLSFQWALVDDECMKALANFKDLRQLDLSGARITDGSLQNLNRLVKLTDLNLLDTRITGKGLRQIGHLTNLVTLDLTDAEISDADLKELSGLKKLRNLDLNGTQITDTGLRELSLLQNLTHLFVRHTGMTNDGLKEIPAFKKLQQLDVADTGVSDAGLEDLCKLKNLEVLYVKKGQLSDEALGKLKSAIPTIYIQEWPEGR